MEFPIKSPKGEGRWALTESRVSAYSATYAVESHVIVAELRIARQWCMDNPGRRKLARGMPKFLGSWLERWNHRGGAVNGNGRAGTRPQGNPAATKHRAFQPESNMPDDINERAYLAAWGKPRPKELA
jgi:hypothetical protein